MFVFSRPKATLRTLHMFIRYFRQNHYEVLKLRKNCSEKEIKEAFIKLSKEYHPDKNKDSNAQENFVRIVEAYNILGKRSSRSLYDHSSEPLYRPSSYQRSPEYPRYSPPNKNKYYDTQRRHQQTRQQAKSTCNEKAGGKRIPNYVLILICFGVAVIGTVLQFVVIREMYVVQKRQALERSQCLAEELQKVRAAAEGKTNEMQTRMLLEKIVGSSNATIATASLGQALATADQENLQEDEESLVSDLEMGIRDLSNFWYTPQQTDAVTCNQFFTKLRMYLYYYCYGR